MHKVQKSITQAYLAKLANVSQKTVNRALSGHADVKPKTRKLIKELAEEHGYMPNQAAQVMRKGRFDTIALLMTSHARFNFVPNNLLNSLVDKLRTNNLNLLLSQFSDEELTDEEFLPDILTKLMCDGLLINYPEHIPERMIELINNYRLPSIWLNRKHDFDCVYHDDFKAGLMATETLLKRGHKKISFLCTSRPTEGVSHYSTFDRIAGYREAMRRAGLPDMSAIAPDNNLTFNERSEMVRHLINNIKATAVITSFIDLERTIYITANLGLKIPEDISVIGFGIAPLTTCGLHVTTMVQSEEEMGTSGVHAMLTKLQNPGIKLPPYVLSFHMADAETISEAKELE